MSEKEEKKEIVEETAEKPKRAPRKRAAAPRKKAAAKKGPKAAEVEEVKEAAPVEVRPVGKGDFILVEMTGRAEETGEVFDTTDEETAKSANIQEKDKVYGPRLVVVGEGWVLKGLDARLEGLKVGETAEVEIPPQEAFGERDPENIRTLPFRLLRSKGINPTVGTQVEFEGRTAVIRSVGAGRVQLDYNPALAGRKIRYTVKVTKRFETDEEKTRALIERRFQGAEAGKFELKLSEKSVRIVEPEEIFFVENLQIAKRALALDIERFFPNVEEVEFVEVVKRKA